MNVDDKEIFVPVNNFAPRMKRDEIRVLKF